MSDSDKDRVRMAREQYQAMQAREKRIQDLREKFQKPGMLMKLCIVVGFGLASGIFSLYKMLGNAN
jgi:hypothetical protein